MTFEEELKEAFDALSGRLQVEVRRQVRAAIDELPAPVAPQPEATEAGPGTEDASERLAGDRQLLEGICAIDDARSLSAILDALATAAGQAEGAIAVILRRQGGWHPWRTVGMTGEIDGAALAERAQIPIIISGETIGIVYAEHGTTARLEILTRHASRCLELMTAFHTARALARTNEPSPSPGEADRDEADAAARRYAKLLVSEIKLYHQGDVVQGCRERDLASRLGGEMARARAMYEQRVPALVRQRTDYFREELVRTLADGDPSLLEAHA